MVSTVKLGQAEAWSQELWVAGAQAFGPSSAAFQGTLARSWIGSSVAGAPAGAPEWDASIARGSLAHGATMLAAWKSNILTANHRLLEALRAEVCPGTLRAGQGSAWWWARTLVLILGAKSRAGLWGRWGSPGTALPQPLVPSMEQAVGLLRPAPSWLGLVRVQGLQPGQDWFPRWVGLSFRVKIFSCLLSKWGVTERAGGGA